jgi:hypothetical protein
MNLINIQAGNIYKNYKHLCEVLEEQPTTGNAKIAQLKEWERFFSYSKNGYKLIITEVFEQPKEKQDLRSQGNNTTHYIPTIEKLILDLLVQDKNNGQVFLSKNMLLKSLKMINDNYTYSQYKTLKLSKLMNITKQEIDDFYNTSSDTLIRNVESALDKLKNQSLIFWNHSITICYVDTEPVKVNALGKIRATRTRFVNEEGTEQYKYNVAAPSKNLVHRKANKDEIKLILHAEHELLERYNCKDKAELYRRGKADDFFREINEALFNAANIVTYYNSYEIICNEDHIYKRWKELEELKLKQRERTKLQKDLNKDVMNKLNENASKRQDRAMKNEMEILLDDSERYWYRLEKSYIDNNKRLTNTLINKNASSIRKELDAIKN